MNSETINVIVEARRGSEKLALFKKENAEEYLRELEDKGDNQ